MLTWIPVFGQNSERATTPSGDTYHIHKALALRTVVVVLAGSDEPIALGHAYDRLLARQIAERDAHARCLAPRRRNPGVSGHARHR
jgi:hypothetical protein